MKASSLRGNLIGLACLYGVSLVVACGCPNSAPPGQQKTPPASASAPEAQSAKPPRDGQDSASQTESKSDEPSAPAGDPRKAAEDAIYQAKHQPVDPVKVNGKYFDGWPRPEVALVFTGRQDGYLEPCGCAGLENQKGGLSRRATMLAELKKQGWPLLPLDVGGLIRRFGQQAEIQFDITADALAQMGYGAVGLGPRDLRLPDTALIATAVNHENLFVATNYSIFEDATPRFRILTVGKKKIGVAAIFGEDFQKEAKGGAITFDPIDESLKKALADLKGCDVKILLAYTSSEDAIELVKKFPDFDYVVSAGGGDEPRPGTIEIADIKTQLIEVGHKGMYAVVIGLYDDKEQPVRYQRVALDSRFKADPAIVELMANYQEKLKYLGWNGLGLQPGPHPATDSSVPDSGKFVGADSCKKCHEDAWKVWSNSKHAHATETLANLKPPRQFDAECVSCHVTGWNAQEFIPYASGFVSLDQTPHLAGNSCENCHGPGAAHIAAENGADKDLRDRLRELARSTAKSEETCIKCHDSDNSPTFDFKKYWQAIEH